MPHTAAEEPLAKGGVAESSPHAPLHHSQAYYVLWCLCVVEGFRKDHNCNEDRELSTDSRCSSTCVVH